MKTAFTLTVLFGMTLSVFSQSLSLSYVNGEIPNNSYVLAVGDPTDEMLESFVYVTNNSSAALDVKLKKVEFYVTSGSSNLFCWGLCYPPNIYVSPDPLNIGPGQTNTEDFHGQYYPMATTGTTAIRYVFFDDNNPSDTVCFNVLYKTDGVPEIANFSPVNGETGSDVTLTITGENTHFDMGFDVMVMLTNGTDEIAATSVDVTSNTGVVAEFSIPSNATTGTYDVVVETILDGIVIASGGFTIYGPSGTDELSVKNLSVYPNPAKEFAILNLGFLESSRVMINVRDITGATIRSIVAERNQEFILKTENLSEGIYFIDFEDNGTVYQTKLIKAN